MKQTKKWEIYFMELENTKGKKFKVTRRMPDMAISETKFFRSKKLAKKQLGEWLK